MPQPSLTALKDNRCEEDAHHHTNQHEYDRQGQRRQEQQRSGLATAITAPAVAAAATVTAFCAWRATVAAAITRHAAASRFRVVTDMQPEARVIAVAVSAVHVAAITFTALGVCRRLLGLRLALLATTHEMPALATYVGRRMLPSLSADLLLPTPGDTRRLGRWQPARAPQDEAQDAQAAQKQDKCRDIVGTEAEARDGSRIRPFVGIEIGDERPVIDDRPINITHVVARYVPRLS